MSQLEILREDILSQNPTDEQKDAIFTDDLEFLLRSAPGSGKTWTSCRRFIWRGSNWPYSVGGLALLSFTNTAIQEFQEATFQLGKHELLSDPNYVGTFDSFVERFILTPFGHLISGANKRPKLFICPREYDWNNEELIVRPETNHKAQNNRPFRVWEVVPYRDKDRTKFSDKRHTVQFPYQTCFEALSRFLSLGFYTHDQRCFWACRLLYERPHVTQVISRRFPEILVDEAQDTNPWLLIILHMLREKGTKITLVGDPDQCIYEFNFAESTSLASLKDKWKLCEKSLSQSFRFHEKIANSVRFVGGNSNLTGKARNSICCEPFIFREEDTQSFSNSIKAFANVIGLLGISESSSAILCRGRTQLNAIRGESYYTKLEGISGKLAEASFLRDCHKDFAQAKDIVEKVLRSLTRNNQFWEEFDEFPDSNESFEIKLAIWDFVKSPSKLPLASLFANEWINQIRENLPKLIEKVGLSGVPNLNKKLTAKGLTSQQKESPLFIARTPFPSIRHETIHKVKGESIDAVLVLGDAGKFWTPVANAIQANENIEVRRLAYVAMTRARHLLVLGLPASHFDKYYKSWEEWGFKVL